MGLPASQIVVLAGGIFILPFFLFSATSGQLADKYEKSKLIRIIKFTEIVIMAIASLGFLTSHFELLLVSLFLMGVHSTAFGPLKYSILPQHLNENEVVGGNALIEAGTFLAILFGTIAGGIIISIPENGALYLSIGIIVTAIAGLGTSYLIPVAEPSSQDIPINWNPIKPTIQILKMAKENENVFYSIMAISWFWFFGAAFLSLFPIYAKSVLSADQSVITLLLATFSVGVAFGSLLCEAMSRKRLELGLVPFGSIGMSIFAMDLYFAGVPLLDKLDVGQSLHTYLTIVQTFEGRRIIFDLFSLATFSGFFIVPLYTYIQIKTPEALRSRIVAANNIYNAIFMVVSSLVLMIVMHFGLAPHEVFFVLGCMNAIVATYIYFFMPEFLLRFYAWCIAHVMYRMTITGHHKIPAEGPAILVCNHVTFVDWLILAAGIRRPARFVMDHSFYKGWLLRTILNQAKVIPIASAKESQENQDRAFDKIKEELAKGEFVCIFPEGKITYDGELNVFKTGIERMIKSSPVPVIPMAMHNLWGSYFSRKGGGAIKKLPRRFWSAISLEIGDPIPAVDVTAVKLQVIVQGMLDSGGKPKVL
ncbi:MAG: MFS transporter [Proteobacteria bacterium]|nr:MFS transporter [Pseudomonadota bacterium]